MKKFWVCILRQRSIGEEFEADMSVLELYPALSQPIMLISTLELMSDLNSC